MKKVLIAILCVFVMSSAKSQESQGFNNHEIMFGVGYFSHYATLTKWSLVLDRLGQLFVKYYEIPGLKRFGDYHISYKYKPIERLMVGGTFAWTGTKSEVFQRTGNGIALKPSMKMGDLRYNFFTLAVELNAIYVNTTNFKLYGNFGLGYTLGFIGYTTLDTMNDTYVGSEKRTKRWNHFNFQISPLSFRFGNNIGGFLEMGWGYKGIFCGGMFVNF